MPGSLKPHLFIVSGISCSSSSIGSEFTGDQRSTRTSWIAFFIAHSGSILETIIILFYVDCVPRSRTLQILLHGIDFARGFNVQLINHAFVDPQRVTRIHFQEAEILIPIPCQNFGKSIGGTFKGDNSDAILVKGKSFHDKVFCALFD